MDPAGVGELTGEGDLCRVIALLAVEWRIEAVDLQIGEGREPGLSLGRLLDSVAFESYTRLS